MDVKNAYCELTGDKTPTVVLSTASPYKFAHDVLSAISGTAPSDAFKAAAKLYEQTAAPIPEQILALKNKEKRFADVIERTETVEAVMKFIDK